MTVFWNRKNIKYISFSHLIITFLLISEIKCCDEEYLKFPKGFQIGAATSAYQIEGAWNINGKGENIWDSFSHSSSSLVNNKSTGDIASDSYHLYKEDFKLLKDIGFDFYRFSISWTRILPNGFANNISKEGIKYYNDLLDELHSKGIKPYVTLYHWDHPQVLEKLGGWTNELMVKWFTDYARVVFRELGPKIKVFITLNEPHSLCNYGYGTSYLAPGMNLPGVANYICGHNMLKAHAKVYHLYKEEFYNEQNGIIGIANVCNSFFAKNENDILQDEAFQLSCGWFSHPIFSKEGDYPQVMKKLVKENSILEGWTNSRLPTFNKKWIDYIRGTADFYALNHYTSRIGERGFNDERNVEWYDLNATFTMDPKWPRGKSFWLAVVPEGLRYILKKLKSEYGNMPIYITENGYSDEGELKDTKRVEYHFLYLKEMLKAIFEDGCNVQAYTAWSLIDNFEWTSGYSEHFGLIKVDFNDSLRRRTPKYSATWFKNLIKFRQLSLKYN
ncbi:myrosinase 1-like [Leptopilina boulardi]|uniref:myrosinase 1-like n=1 Tax=Leptopilina boulardi TaxID=63433 RepID=UPI0021F5ECFA|nr:myrosinase 1-like [Leptopilina boulardi]